MKTKILSDKSPVLFFLMIIFGAFLFSGCSKDTGNNNPPDHVVYTIMGDASGAQVSPPVATAGTGKLVGTYDATDNKFEYSIEWTSLTDAATAIEIHGPADPGVNGDLIFSVTITGGGVSGAKSVTATFTEQQEMDLIAGKLYFTVINAAHLSGEVRGQIYRLIR